MRPCGPEGDSLAESQAVSQVLVISPHMDDEVLGCGGTMVRHVEAGDEVHVCILCNRAYGHSYDSRAIETEKENARKAQAILGYKGLSFFDLPDERLEGEFPDLLKLLEEVVGQVRPEVVYTCHAGDLHQDHRTVARASNIVLRSVSAPFVREVLAYEVPSGTDQVFPGDGSSFLPTVFVDIERQLDRKCQAMAAYERESRRFPHPRSPEMLKALAQVRGAQCGRPAAESFVLLRQRR